MARRKREAPRLDVLSKLLLRYKRENTEKEELLLRAQDHMFRIDYLTFLSFRRPEPNPIPSQPYTVSESERELCWKTFRDVLWAPSPDGAWERGLEATVRLLAETRALVGDWTDADEK